MVFKKGKPPWNKGLTKETDGRLNYERPTTFKKGCIPEKAWKKGQKPWNYIDGRSKLLSPGRYGSDWKKIKTRILIREDYKCQKCGIHKSKITFMDIHHIKPFLKSFDNSEENLMVLCRKCHVLAEREVN